MNDLGHERNTKKRIKNTLYNLLLSRSSSGFDGLHAIWEDLTIAGATKSDIVESAYSIDPDLGDAVLQFNVDKMEDLLSRLAISDVVQVNNTYPWGEIPTLEEFIHVWNEVHDNDEIEVDPPTEIRDDIDVGVYNYGSIYNKLEELLAEYDSTDLDSDRSASVADSLEYLVEVSGMEWV